MAGLNATATAFPVALFGPQATRWTHSSLRTLQVSLQHKKELAFLVETVEELDKLSPVLEKLHGNCYDARDDIVGLQRFFSTDHIPDWEKFTNAQLAVLTVVAQVVEIYEKQHTSDAFWDFQCVQGFCIGFLTAVALSLSHTQLEFERHASTAVRLALCIGTIVDAENASHEPPKRATALALKWENASDRSLLDTHLDLTLGAYVSCVTDVNALTLTLPRCEEASFRARLRTSNIKITPIGLHGCYHHSKHHGAAQKLKQLSDNESRLRLADASALRFPLRSTSDTTLIASGLLHETAIDLILCKRAHWFTTVKVSLENTPWRKSDFTAIGHGSTIPRSLVASHLGVNTGNLVQKQPEEEIAVVGLSCRFPKAESIHDFWTLLTSGATAVGEIPINRFTPSQIMREPKLHTFWGNFLDDVDAFDHRFFGVSGREAKSMDPQQRLALQVAYEALESCGYHAKSLNQQRADSIGCYLGVGSVDYSDNVGSENANAFSALGTLRAFISGRISHFFGWDGPSITFDTACSSSAVAIHTACRAIIGGECSMALAGGVNVITSPDLHQNLAAASFLNPTGSSKAFDANANGYCRGEGAGMVVLKRLSRAIADRDHIFGVISGSAVNQGSNTTSITVPDSQSQSELYQRALSLSHIEPSEVTYVEAHGTGTQTGDPIEYESIRRALSRPERIDTLYVGSVKDNIGHCEAASGAAGLIKSLLMLQHGIIPKQANFKSLNPKLNASSGDKILVPTATQPWLGGRRIALINNYGAAGSNAAILLRNYEQVDLKDSSDSDNISAWPFILSAKTSSSLLAYLNKLKSYVTSSNRSLAEIAYNLNWKQNPILEYRASFVASGIEDFLTSAKDVAAKSNEKLKQTAKSPIVLCFGGQTGVCVTILKKLYLNGGLLRQHLDQCDKVCESLELPSLFPSIFSAEPTDDVVALHCQLLALQVASARSWIGSGLEIDTLVGHSFGQISALCVADSLSLEDAFRFVSGRAQLMRSSWGPEKGLMLSIDGDLERIQHLVNEANSNYHLQLEIACYNGPNSFVVAGSALAIAKVEELAGKLKVTRLGTSHAYHSHLVDPIMGELQSLASAISIRKPSIRVETCSAGASWTQFTAEELASHTRNPVYFTDAIQRITTRIPCATWLEAGSASSIIPMARRLLRTVNRADSFIPLDLGSASADTDLANTASRLWQSGYNSKFWPFSSSADNKYRFLDLPPYQFEKMSHWIQYRPRPSSFCDTATAKNQPGKQCSLVSLFVNNPAKGINIFSVETTNIAFDLTARGHAVVGQSLCPASMYIEIALSGAQQLLNKHEPTTTIPHIDGLVMSAPLGIGSNYTVKLRLQKNLANMSWNFSIYSQPSPANGSQVRTVEHARGTMSLGAPDDIVAKSRIQLLKRINRHSRVNHIINSPSTGIEGAMVYKLFSEVVDYADYYRGVQSILSIDNEAVGVVTVPKQQLLGLDSFVTDPISLDNFLQVAGIHVNCLRPRSKDEVFVCTAVEELIFTKSLVLDKHSPGMWTVYTRYDQGTTTGVINDIFVYDKTSEELVLAIAGATFKSVSLRSLSRGLSVLNRPSKPPLSRSTSPSSSASEDPTIFSDENEQKTAASSPAITDETIISKSSSIPAPSSLGSGPLDYTGRQYTKEADNAMVRLRQMLSDIIEIPTGEIKAESTFEELGIDSLLVTEVLSELQSRFNIDFTQPQVLDCANVTSLWQLIQASQPGNEPVQLSKVPSVAQKVQPELSISSYNVPTKSGVESAADIATISLRAFLEAVRSYEQYAESTGLRGFYTDVFPLQSALVVKYVTDAFSKLGVDIETVAAGEEVPLISFHEKHRMLIPQLYRILADAGLVKRTTSGTHYRTLTAVPNASASMMSSVMLEKSPQHASETRLLAVTGCKLAECLSGAADPISLIFKDTTSKELLMDVYTNAPMFKASTLVLNQYLSTILQKCDANGKVRILEIGGGTGGTTKQLLETIVRLNLEEKVSYTFTDLSSSLLAAARRNFARYSFMAYSTLDIGEEPKSNWIGSFDVIISTNCIHATSNLVESATNIRKMLKQTGVLCLIELTRNLFWFDLVFGLLEGWWLFSDGRDHALAHEARWKQDLHAAGFKWVDWSNTTSAESDICRLIIASPTTVEHDAGSPSSGPKFEELRLKETLIYKKVEGLDLEADLYYPPEVADGRELPVALMIHGGGHVMLSRNDIRKEQTRELLERGFLPISIDYRLCPEVTLQDGAMPDIVDSLAWVRKTLPRLRLARPDIKVDRERVVVVGWSTGGMLAMSMSWSAVSCGIQPPDATLAFYCPTDYEDEFWTKPNVPASSRTVTESLVDLDEQTWTGIFDSPIKCYTVPSDQNAIGGWLAPTDPRSRVALYMNHQGRTLHTLLRGLNKQSREVMVSALPSSAEVKSISPLAQIRANNYCTPTFIIHPRDDDLIPWQQAERAVEALNERGICAELRILEEVPHLFDVYPHWRRNKAAEQAIKEGYDFLSRFGRMKRSD